MPHGVAEVEKKVRRERPCKTKLRYHYGVACFQQLWDRGRAHDTGYFVAKRYHYTVDITLTL
jgi:hypothetical protein